MLRAKCKATYLFQLIDNKFDIIAETTGPPCWGLQLKSIPGTELLARKRKKDAAKMKALMACATMLILVLVIISWPPRKGGGDD